MHEEKKINVCFFRFEYLKLFAKVVSVKKRIQPCPVVFSIVSRVIYDYILSNFICI